MMKRHVRTVVLSCCLFGAPWSVAEEAASKVLVAEDLLPQLRSVLEQALKQSPRMVDKNLEVLQADASAYMAAARRYPSAYGTLNYNAQTEDRANDYKIVTVNGVPVRQELGWQAGTRLGYNFSVNQPIWHWGILEAANEVGKIGKEIARRNYSEAYRHLALEVRSAYLQLVLSKMHLRNNAFTEKLARENLKRQESRFATAQITMGEIMAARLTVDETSLATRRATTDLGFVLRNFRRLTGLADFAETDIPSEIPGVEQAPIVAQPVGMTVMLESNAAKNSALELKRAQLDFRNARFNRYPKLNLSAGLYQDQISYTADLAQRYQVQTAFVGASFSWNIFDGPTTKGLQLASMTRIRQAERTRDSLHEALRQQAEAEALAVTYAWEHVRNSAMKFRFAREGLLTVKENFGRGQASQEQVDQVQSMRNGAEYSYHSALSGYLNAAAQYLSTARADPFASTPVQP